MTNLQTTTETVKFFVNGVHFSCFFAFESVILVIELRNNISKRHTNIFMFSVTVWRTYRFIFHDNGINTYKYHIFVIYVRRLIHEYSSHFPSYDESFSAMSYRNNKGLWETQWNIHGPGDEELWEAQWNKHGPKNPISILFTKDMTGRIC